MMLPGNRPSTPLTPATASTPRPEIAVPIDVDGNNSSHADYDLNPLTVYGLDHYVERDDDERFHIR
jgi:hypothetical protein